MKKRIIVQRGDEYSTKVSNIYQENDFFYEAYCQAAQGVRDIVKTTANYYHEDRKKQTAFNSTQYMRLAGYPNNIIAFCAGRGQGKSSAMLSFSSALRFLDEEDQTALRFWGEDIQRCSFFVLNPIDPTMLSGEDSILRVIISRMFDSYAMERRRKDCLNHHEGDYDPKEPELLKSFRKCFRNLDILQKGTQIQDCYDDLEYLADLGDSSNIKKSFLDLTSNFLEAVRRRDDMSCARRFLVLQIDDADLNASSTYRIVEELRKYCVIPNVIILMATDFEQMELSVEQYFIQVFKTLCDQKKDDQKMTLGHCHKMMERYLDKLIPGTRQVHLPKIDNFIQQYENDLLLWYEVGKQTEKVGEKDFQEMLLKLIYEKTGLILVKPRGYRHNFLPESMRELTHMLAFLTSLKSIPVGDGALTTIIKAWRPETKDGEGEGKPGLSEKNKAALDIRRKNIDSFVDYLRHCWVKVALTEKQQAVINPVMEANGDLKAKLLLFGLRRYGREKYEDWEKDADCIAPQYIDVIETLMKLKAGSAVAEDFGLIYISAALLTIHMNLLVLQDLEEGVEFRRLRAFMGHGVFPEMVGMYSYGDLRYDQLDLVYDLSVMAVGSDGIKGAHRDVRHVSSMLLTHKNSEASNGKKPVSGLDFINEDDGDRVSFLSFVENTLSRITHEANPDVLAETLDIILSWDLQYRITKELKQLNDDIKDAKDEKNGWLSFQTWILRQFRTMDNVYRNSLEVLDIHTVKPALHDAVSKGQALLAAWAIGNPEYARGWWQTVKEMLVNELTQIYDAMSLAVSNMVGKAPNAYVLLDSARRLANMPALVADCVPNNNFLSERKLYHRGITPQSVIDSAREILPLNDKELISPRRPAEKIIAVQSRVADCLTQMKKIELIYSNQSGSKRNLSGQRSAPAQRKGGKQRQTAKPNPKPANSQG